MSKPLMVRVNKVTGRLYKKAGYRVPRILLENHWLAEAGFCEGDDMLVTVPQLGVIVLTRRTNTNADERRRARSEIAHETWRLGIDGRRLCREALAPAKRRRRG